MKQIIFLTVIVLGLLGCTYTTNISYKAPVNKDDGFEVANLEHTLIDTALIQKGINKMNSGKFGEVHAMLIYKNKALVVEQYFKGHTYQWDAKNYYGDLIQWDINRPHHIMSCTKSFTSALIGIAIDKGFINNINQSIFDYLPDYQHLKTNKRNYITIEHLLTMTAGLEWDEWSSQHGTSANDIDMLYLDCKDPIVCVLENPWWAEPGKMFTYNGGGMVILGEILKNASNMDMDEFSMKYLFEPLGIDSTQWTQFENGMYDGANSLRITPRDMMKFGVTYLNDGIWNDERIISSKWVANSSKIYKNNSEINIPLEDSGKCGYGYLWWISEFSHQGKKIKMFRAGGWGGQEIMIFPELEMVVVFTGGNYSSKSHLYKIIKRYVLPAVA